MKTLQYNFTVPQDIVEKLKEVVAKRERSAFVSAAIKEKLQRQEKEQLNQELIEGYKAMRRENKQTNAEWEAATLEGWE